MATAQPDHMVCSPSPIPWSEEPGPTVYSICVLASITFSSSLCNTHHFTSVPSSSKLRQNDKHFLWPIKEDADATILTLKLLPSNIFRARYEESQKT